MIRKAKKGSSLVTVLMIFSILSIFGISIFTTTYMTFKNTVTSNQVKKNIYYSEAGINEAYGLVGKLIDQAVLKGNKAVSDSISDLNELIKSELDLMKNDDTYKSPYINEDLTVNIDYVKTNWNDKKFKEAYQNYITLDKLKSEIADQGKYSLADDLGVKPTIVIDEARSMNAFDKDILDIVLASTFSSKNVKKTLEVEMHIKTPEYESAFNVTSNILKLPRNKVFSKALMVQKDMDIKNDLTVNGDLYVKGNTKGISVVGDGSHLNFNGNVITGGDFQINANNVTLTGQKDMFLGSLYIGDSVTDDDKADNVTVTLLGSVYANNDISINGLKNNIEVGKFLGINRETFGVGTEGEVEKTESEKAKSSSSILINSEDIGAGSYVKVNNEALLMGVSYIDTNDAATGAAYKYQTGESLAIRGNFIAYNYEFPDGSGATSNGKSITESNVVFKNFVPLQLCDAFYSVDDKGVESETRFTIFDRANYINEYSKLFDVYDPLSDPDPLNLTGVSLPINTKSVGAYVSNGKLKNGNITIEENLTLGDNYKKDYAKQVDGMGDATGVVYPSMGTVRNVYVKGDLIHSQIDFDKASFNGKVTLPTGDIIYINNDTSKKCVLKSEAVSYTPVDPLKEEVISLPTNAKGIIITNSDLDMLGNFDFTGTIICNGNLTVKDTAVGTKKTFTYNKNYVERLITYNYSYFQDLFINGDESDPITIEVGATVSEYGSLFNQPRNNLVTFSKWKILK